MAVTIGFFFGRFHSAREAANIRSPSISDTPSVLSTDEAEASSESRTGPMAQLQSTPKAAVQQPIPEFSREDTVIGRERRSKATVEADFAPKLSEYATAFQNLGIPEEKAAELIDRLKSIIQLTFISGAAQTDVYDARQGYDRELQRLLSPTDYARYREFENVRQDNRDMDRLREFATAAGNFIAEDSLAIVQSALRNTGGYTVLSNIGPYDDAFVLQYGREMLLDGMTKNMGRLGSVRDRMMSELADKLPEADLTTVAGFYAAQIANLEKSQQALLSEVESIEEIYARLHAKDDPKFLKQRRP